MDRVLGGGMPKIARSPAQSGFTLIELLTALVLSAILVLVVGRTLRNALHGQDALGESLVSLRDEAVFRRLLHRDLASMLDLNMTITSTGFAFDTSHALAMDQPLPVLVEYDFSHEQVLRRESMEDQGYVLETVLVPKFKAWSLELYAPWKSRWMPLDSWLMSRQESRIKDLRALRLTLEVDEHFSFTQTERFPYALFAE